MRRQALKALILLLVILFITWVNRQPEWIESIYASNVYPFLSRTLGYLFSWIPFSVGDVFYLVICGLLLGMLFRFLKRLFTGKFRNASYRFLQLLVVLEGLVIVFYLFWGMNYFRYSTAARLDLDRKDYRLEDLQPAAAYLIDRANHYRALLPRGEMEKVKDRQIYRAAEQAYRDLGKSNPAFRVPRPRVKPALFTPLINFMGVAGYFNPFTGEAQVNYAMPVFVKPFVACHEIAHQAGFGPEDAASFAGFLAGTYSDDRLLQYSVHYTAMKDVLYEISRIDRTVYSELVTRISPEIREDIEIERRYWARYRGPVDAISDFFYDHFLKANNQPKGLRTYNEMIGLLIAHYQKQGILPQ